MAHLKPDVPEEYLKDRKREEWHKHKIRAVRKCLGLDSPPSWSEEAQKRLLWLLEDRNRRIDSPNAPTGDLEEANKEAPAQKKDERKNIETFSSELRMQFGWPAPLWCPVCLCWPAWVCVRKAGPPVI